MPNLLFCMTPGIGLNVWKNIGSLNRELKPYLEYARRGWNVKILTFDSGDLPELPEGIETVRFPHKHLLWFLPWTHRKLGRWADLIKTNQSYLAFYYTRIAKQWKKPILLRCGYVHGEYLETTKGMTLGVKLYQWFEKRTFQQATHCQVPTQELSYWIQEKYNISKTKIQLVPNFVDTDAFKPIPWIHKRPRSVISVGRLSPVKKFDLLIRSCSAVPGCELTLVGEGPEREKLRKLANDVGLKLTLLGNIANEKLVNILQEHAIFVITSVREGHPKALIEAMACGMPCVGVNAVGINNIIKKGLNGWLVQTTHEDITNGILRLTEDEKLCQILSRGARGYALRHYEFNACFSKEYNLINNLIKNVK